MKSESKLISESGEAIACTYKSEKEGKKYRSLGTYKQSCGHKSAGSRAYEWRMGFTQERTRSPIGLSISPDSGSSSNSNDRHQKLDAPHQHYTIALASAYLLIRRIVYYESIIV